MGPILGRQDLGVPHVGPRNFAIWEYMPWNMCKSRLDIDWSTLTDDKAWQVFFQCTLYFRDYITPLWPDDVFYNGFRNLAKCRDTPSINSAKIICTNNKMRCTYRVKSGLLIISERINTSQYRIVSDMSVKCGVNTQESLAPNVAFNYSWR